MDDKIEQCNVGGGHLDITTFEKNVSLRSHFNFFFIFVPRYRL